MAMTSSAALGWFEAGGTCEDGSDIVKDHCVFSLMRTGRRAKVSRSFTLASGVTTVSVSQGFFLKAFMDDASSASLRSSGVRGLFLCSIAAVAEAALGAVQGIQTERR